MTGPALPQGRRDISIVVPLYNESEVFPELFRRLRAVLDARQESCEVLLVDDGSRDGTGDAIREASRSDPRFVGIHFSRNFGHQAAVSAGLRMARGDVVAVIDGDLQDPPESIFAMVEKLAEGWDVVYAVRGSRRENILLRTAYAVFYRLLKGLASIEIPLDSGDCSVMRRPVVDVINESRERHRFVRGLRSYAGFRQTGFLVDRDARGAGKPKYTFTRLVGLAADGVFCFSEKPLRIATAAGVVVALGAMAYGAYLLAWRIMGNDDLPGFATLAVGMAFLGGVQLLCIGILGEYVGRIHNEVKDRPPWVVAEVSGGEDGDAPAPSS